LIAIQKTVRAVVTMPGIGAPCTLRHSDLKGIRRIPVTNFENWLVFYRDTPEHLDVIRVLHGARDIEAIFDDEA
jgi:toxin ParE1/3/4